MCGREQRLVEIDYSGATDGMQDHSSKSTVYVAVNFLTAVEFNYNSFHCDLASDTRNFFQRPIRLLFSPMLYEKAPLGKADSLMRCITVVVDIRKRKGCLVYPPLTNLVLVMWILQTWRRWEE